MELYSAILFVHIVSGMGMAASLAMIIATEARARGAKTPADLRALYTLDERIAAKMKMLALVLATTGLYMAHSRWSLVSAWVVAAIVIFIYLASTGPLVFGRHMRATVELAEHVGAIDAAVRMRLNDPTVMTLGRLRVAFLALLVFLMTLKPGLAVTLTAFVAALVLGVASGAVAKRVSREMSAAAGAGEHRSLR